MSRLVSVAVPVPGLNLLTYRLPEDLTPVQPGVRVLVPLGARTVTGCVIEVDPAPAPIPDIKDVVDVLDVEPFLRAEIVDLARWVAEYYAAGPGEAIAAAMPPYAWVVSERLVQITPKGAAAMCGTVVHGLRAEVLRQLLPGKPVPVRTLATSTLPGRSSSRSRSVRTRGIHSLIASLARNGLIAISDRVKGQAAAFKTVGLANLTVAGCELAGRVADESRGLRAQGPGLGGLRAPRAQGARGSLGPSQAHALELLRGAPEGLSVPALRARGVTTDALGRLRDRGLLTLERVRVDRDPFEAGSALDPLKAGLSDQADPDLLLTSEQDAALTRLRALADERRFRVALVHGVTGSGKTEIYLRLAGAVRDQGRRVLVLVPEIALTPAVASKFRQRFGDRVAIQHSALSDGERHDQWQRIRRGEIDVVVGTRSAVFAPLEALGLVIVDEEHDTSYKQEESPRYHGRDVAVVRAQRAGALVVLGSATPSMESYHNARAGRYELVVLRHRVFERPLAAVRVVDMREEFAANGPDVIVSAPLREALGARLERGEQALILLNRRGFATAIFCRQCGATVECPNCAVALTVHRAARRARCHYCNYSMSIPGTCRACAGPFLEQMGFGTERVEAAVKELFPVARIARVDRDTMRRRGAIVRVLDQFARREIDVLVGTQMIAKGHDFPSVTLVGVISADVGLGLADFRAAERTFQLLTQVAGRAGRGDLAGEAIIQTLHPGHYSVRCACSQDYEAFFAEEIRYRRAMHYPPVVALVNALVRARDRSAAMGRAEEIAATVRSHPAFRVLGPAPAPLIKLRGEHRAQIFLKGRHRAAMRSALQKAVASDPELRRRVTIDVDPLAML